VTSEAGVDTAAVVKKKDPPISPEDVNAEQVRAAGLQLTGDGGYRSR